MMRRLIALAALASLALAGCGKTDASVTLVFPNAQARTATKLIEVYQYPRNEVAVGGRQSSCNDYTGKIVQGEPTQSDPISNPLESPFEGRLVQNFPKGNPIIFVV